MGCGTSFLGPGRQHVDGGEYSTAVANLGVGLSLTSTVNSGVQLKVLQQEFKDIKDFYSFGRIIGKGQFGTVRQVTEKATGDKFACKSVSKRRLLAYYSSSSTSSTSLLGRAAGGGGGGGVVDVLREIQIMHHLAGHPNIVTIKDVYEDRCHVHLVEELCTGGELFDSIIARGHYSERDAAAAFRCIAAVVAHCHNMGVLHRDIKPENFLLSSSSPDAAIKGTDFGLSVFFNEGQTFTEMVGSAFYMAPEVLRKRYDKRADVWSLGVLLYIMLCGLPPFYAETEQEVFAAILTREVTFNGEPWAAVSEGAKDVVRRMLERNPRLRATALEVLDHDWVREGGTADAGPLDNEVLMRLKDFGSLNKLQQEALKVIATNLPDPEVTGLRALFKEMDADSSGSITVEELRQALQRKGIRISPEELENLMARVDISGDGTLDYEEFLAATMNLTKLDSQEHLHRAFKFFDTDDSGYITREELSQVLSKTCSAQEIDAMLSQADSSGDGRIDYMEFCEMMRGGNKALLPRAIGQAASCKRRQGQQQQQQQGQQHGQEQQQNYHNQQQQQQQVASVLSPPAPGAASADRMTRLLRVESITSTPNLDVAAFFIRPMHHHHSHNHSHNQNHHPQQQAADQEENPNRREQAQQQESQGLKHHPQHQYQQQQQKQFVGGEGGGAVAGVTVADAHISSTSGGNGAQLPSPPYFAATPTPRRLKPTMSSHAAAAAPADGDAAVVAAAEWHGGGRRVLPQAVGLVGSPPLLAPLPRTYPSLQPPLPPRSLPLPPPPP